MVLVGAVAGVNVFLILTIGAVLSLIVGVASGRLSLDPDLLCDGDWHHRHV